MFMENIFKILRNYILIKRFPFLHPPEDYCGNALAKHDYRYTYLDDIPDGWRKAFGVKLCKELKAQLKKDGLLEKYQVEQVKEKYGTLCWYDSGGNEATEEIVMKYEDVSESVCALCGKPSSYITSGYVLYICKACYEKSVKHEYASKLTWSDTPHRNYRLDSGDYVNKFSPIESTFEKIWDPITPSRSEDVIMDAECRKAEIKRDLCIQIAQFTINDAYDYLSRMSMRVDDERDDPDHDAYKQQIDIILAELSALRKKFGGDAIVDYDFTNSELKTSKAGA
jgi:hypothetical protein